MIGYLLGALAIVSFGLYARFRPGWRKTGPYFPDSFVAGLALFAIGGAVNAVEMRSPPADEVAVMGCLALCSGLAGAIIGSIAHKQRAPFAAYVETSIRRIAGAERMIIRVGLVACALVCLWFIRAVLTTGPVSTLLSIKSLVDDSSSLTSARKAITAGTEGYFAPGYVKQFRDILSPIFLSALFAINRKGHKSVLFWIVAGITLAAMLLTGQRSILVIFIATLLLAAHYTIGLRKRTLLIAIGITVVCFGFLTVMLGRLSQNAGTLESIGAIAESTLERVFVAPPNENTVTYPVWKDAGPTMGQSWLDDFAGSFAGKSTARLSSALHAEAGGSEEGNSPLAFPIDTWFAWGWAGLVLIPMIFAICLAVLDRILLSTPSVVFCALKCYLFFVIPIFYSPYLFFLYGGAVTLMLIVVISMVHASRRGVSQGSFQRPSKQQRTLSAR